MIINPFDDLQMIAVKNIEGVKSGRIKVDDGSWARFTAAHWDAQQIATLLLEAARPTA